MECEVAVIHEVLQHLAYSPGQVRLMAAMARHARDAASV